MRYFMLFIIVAAIVMCIFNIVVGIKTGNLASTLLGIVLLGLNVYNLKRYI